MKTPLLFRYPGGKHYAINILQPFWEAVEHDEYREPFVGGGSVFFNKPKSKINILNDLDEELISVYKCVSDIKTREALIKLVSREIATPERWKEVFAMVPKNNIEMAFKYYYLNRTSFSGKLVSPSWGYRPKRSLPPERWSERLSPCGEKLKNTEIKNLDFTKIIGRNSEHKTLIYVDPPYFLPPKRKHYRHGFDYSDHIRLSESLKKTKHKFFLTYDDAPEIREIYSWAKIYPTKFFYRVENSATQNGARKLGFELIISNYEVT
jgi:DNA adenine methylase